MARKRLSDLLREEAQKAPETTPDVPDGKGFDTAGKNQRASASRASKEKSAAARGSAAAEVIEPDASSSETKSETKIAELQEAIAASNQQESDLKQQIAELKAELKTHTASSKKLQTNLDKAEKRQQQLEEDLIAAQERNQHLEQELTDVKQTTLHLAETNSQLKQDLEELRRSQSPKTPERKLPLMVSQSPPQTNTAPAKETGKLATKSLTQQEILRRRQADSLAHPVFPAGQSPGHISETDFGWVD